MALLRQNSELRKDGIWNWTIPAWKVRLDDGKLFKTCPNAGICAQFCYALNGTYLFSNVKASHKANLDYVLNQPDAFEADMIHELQMVKFRPKKNRRSQDKVDRLLAEGPTGWLEDWLLNGGAAVRIHDAGDFFAQWYLDAWIRIAEATPDVLFYAYTKEVQMFIDSAPRIPENFRYLFSTGGLQDHLIQDRRHADVFPDDAMADGYDSQSETDLLAIFGKSERVGIPANNIKHFKKKMAGRRFSELTKPRPTS